MEDVLFIFVIIAFFLLCWAFVRLCDKV